MLDFSVSLKSRASAVGPATYDSTPLTEPSVVGTSSLRTRSSASFDASSVPSPAIAIVSVATDLSGFTSTSIRPPGNSSGRLGDLALELVDPCRHRRSADVVGLDEDVQPARLARERRLHAIVRLNDRLVLRQRVRARLTGLHAQRRQRHRDEQPGGQRRRQQRATQHTVDDPRPDADCRPSGCAGVQGRERGPARRASPSLDMTAGSTVSEPSTDTATTRIVPVANDVNVAAPARYMPAIEVITVMPGDEHGAAGSGRRGLEGGVARCDLPRAPHERGAGRTASSPPRPPARSAG